MKRTILLLVFLFSLQKLICSDSTVFYTISVGIKDILIHNRSILHDSDSLFNEIIKNKRVTLDYKQNDITIVWVDSDTAPLANYEFTYMLEGFDREWIYSQSDRKTRYTNLDPGVYTFRIKYSIDHIWETPGDSLKITIISPWWKSRWFRTLMIALIILVVYFNRQRTIKRKAASN